MAPPSTGTTTACVSAVPFSARTTAAATRCGAPAQLLLDHVLDTPAHLRARRSALPCAPPSRGKVLQHLKDLALTGGSDASLMLAPRTTPSLGEAAWPSRPATASAADALQSARHVAGLARVGAQPFVR